VEEIVIRFLIDPEHNAHLQALADAVPIPFIFKDTLRDLSKGSGIKPGELMNLVFIDWQARNCVEQEKLGNILSNPFWKVAHGGFLEDYDEIYLFLKQRYEKTLDDKLTAGNDNK